MRGDLGEAVPNGVLKGCAIRIVLRVEPFLFDKLPQSLNQIKSRGIGVHVEQCDAQGCGQGLAERTALIAGIVQDNGDWHPWVGPCQPLQQLTDSRGGSLGGSAYEARISR